MAMAHAMERERFGDEMGNRRRTTFAVSVPRPKPAASDRERHAGLVAAYTDALDAAWGIGHTHFVEPHFGRPY